MIPAGLLAFVLNLGAGLVGLTLLGLLLGRLAPASARLAQVCDNLLLGVPVLGLVILTGHLTDAVTTRIVSIAIAVVWALPPVWRSAAQANSSTGIEHRAAVAFELTGRQLRQLTRHRWMPNLLGALGEGTRRLLAALMLGGIVGQGLGRDLLASLHAQDWPQTLVVACWIIAIALTCEIGWFAARHVKFAKEAAP